jgi:integrase
MKGMGRVFRRGPVWWVAYYHRGKEFRESSGSESEAQARKLLKKRLGEMGRGRLIGPVEEKVTFDAMSQDFIADYQTNRKRSLRSAKLSVGHLQAFFGLDRALDITTDRIRIYISHRQGEGASNSSINRELAGLKRMFSLAVQAGKLSSRPYIPMLEENNARQGFLDHGGFLTLRENLPEYLKDPVTFLYLSGWRVGEMKALEWRDVDLPGKVVRLRPEIAKNKEGRVLPLSRELLEVIKRAREKRRPECVFVFHLNGEPVGDFRKAWHNACVAAGLGKFVVHDLRRSAVTRQGPDDEPGTRKKKKYVGIIIHDLRRTAIRNMVRAGVRERVAMSLSGHKTRSIFDRYNIVSEDDLARASDMLEAHLKKQVKARVIHPLKKAVGQGNTDKTRTMQFVDQMTFHRQSAQVLERFGGPPETRTPDPLIKSQLLYQLS